eukprot:TRINITY_DN3372_c0_g5_i1.p1 TRINITY_DN3372_c0_g5~~TRINITY_DN3372_c0_g5_i1.p1  ORF type:complete len:343 (-),score=59.88 TRINITY_DN3372_c0_g5_i1:710-1738(-)
MPAVPLVFRARCGGFMAVYINFMFRRAKKKAELRCRTLKPRCRSDGVMVGLVLTVFFYSNLLMQCGDIEPNPGPPKNVKQTRQNSSSGSSSVSLDKYLTDPGNSAQSARQEGRAVSEPTLADVSRNVADVMTMLTCMNGKFDNMKDDFKDIKESYSDLKKEVESLNSDVEMLRQSNDALTESNKRLQESVNRLESKTDDLECRSKRKNIIVHGIPRFENETAEQCEGVLKDMITDKLELSDDFEFDRVHRLSSKKESPMIARCTFYKEKVTILKAKYKLKGTSIFLGEDFSQRVRAIRKKLLSHLRAAKDQGKRATMIYDHLIIDGNKFVLADDETSIFQVS